MKISRKQRRWLRLLLILMAIRVVIGGLIWIFVTYRFGEIVEAVVKRETKGQYAFNAKDIDVSLWHRTIRLENSELYCVDTISNPNRYALKIPLIYFSLHSVMDLVLHKEVSVDSVEIVSPDVGIHYIGATTDTAQFRPARLVEMLKTLALHLKVRSLNIRDASLTLVNAGSKAPFSSSHINFYVRNFSKKSGKREYLFSSEDVDLAIYDQHWLLPDGAHEVSFKKLHFSSANQYFEMDSPVFKSPPLRGKAGFEFAANKLFFNSNQLQSIYEFNELNLDTLLCLNPVLKVETVAGDTTHFTAINMHYFFHKLRFKYIAINDGELVVSHKNSSLQTYIAQQANIKIFGLRINPDDSVKMDIDSASLVLNNIKFLSKDSLFQLAISKFVISRNEVLLSGASYGPTEFNRSARQLFFIAPYMRLRNVDFEDLLQRKLTGSYAELGNPEISVRNSAKPGTLNAVIGQRSSVNEKATRLSNFYKTLHDLHDLIDVDSFRLIKANLHYDVSASSTHMFMRTLDATILLNRFLTSDSLIDIKRSLPGLTIKELHIQTPNADFLLGNYSFNGANRRNGADYLTLNLSSQTRVIARQLYWEILDWDLFENHRIIQCDDLRIHSFSIFSHKTRKDTVQKKELPVIHVGRLDIDSLYFVKYGNTDDSIRFDAGNICIDDIHTGTQFFLFGNALAEVFNLRSDNANTHLIIGGISISNEVPTTLRSIQYYSKKENGSSGIDIPLLTLSAKIHSTDFSKFQMDSVGIDQPTIALTNTGQKGSPFRIIFPFQLELKKGTVHGAIFKMESSPDTLIANATMDIDINSLATDNQNNDIIKYDKIAIQLSDFTLTKNNLKIALPGAGIQLSNGQIINPDKPYLTSSLNVNWSNAEIYKNTGDSSSFRIAHLAGTIESTNFSTENKTRFSEILSCTSLQYGSLSYEGKKWMVNASSFSWNPQNQDLHLRDFSLLPRLDKEEYFRRNGWQCDYLKVNVGKLDMRGVKLRAEPRDSSIQVRKLVLGDVQISTSRDKRMPFQHGITKPMPTTLIETIHLPFNIDSIELSNGAVTINETALNTGKQGTIRITDLNATITGMNNRKQRDSLEILAGASLFGTKISRFHFAERFDDTLGGFSMSYCTYPIQLKNLNEATVPLASLKVKEGNADTLYADWQGNKYAAIGNMHFYYRDLKIKILDPQNATHSSIKLRLENMLANTFVLRGRNDRSSVAWFVRDQDKFVFNYWVKTTLGGIVSSVGFVKDSKYLDQYQAKRVMFSLPDYKKPE